MDEGEYLMRIEDDYADLIMRLHEQRRAITTPDTANDIPINEAVAACARISAESHAALRPHETAGGMLT